MLCHGNVNGTCTFRALVLSVTIVLVAESVFYLQSFMHEQIMKSIPSSSPANDAFQRFFKWTVCKYPPHPYLFVVFAFEYLLTLRETLQASQ